MDPVTLRAFQDELGSPMVKQALIEHLTRLGATDVEHLPGLNKVFSNTPRLFMRQRSPQELGQLQHNVGQWFARKEQPIINALHHAVDKRLPQVINTPGRLPNIPLAKGVKNLGETVIRNPEVLATEALPGGSLLSVGWLKAKRGLENAIDKHIPVPMPGR